MNQLQTVEDSEPLDQMESVQELCVHIAKLNIKIELQRQLLANLKCNKSLAHCQLNIVLDPVVCLPLEILSKIFVLSHAPFPELGAIHIPMILLNVCNAWSNIALSTPALWATIGITFCVLRT